MAEESIYKFINRMSGKNAGLPYAFQNPYSTGRMDVRFVLWEDELSFLAKEKLSMELMKHLVASVGKGSPTEELRRFLDEKPIFLYLTKLNERLKLYLSQKLLDVKKLYTFAVMMATESSSEEDVKLGMVVLGFFENDFSKQILKTLGLHSSFTLYALAASTNFTCGNEFVFELARNTCGYGKLAALHFFQPVLPNQKKWLFNQGIISEAVPNIAAVICIEKVDMADFYRSIAVTEETFPKISYMLAYAAEKNNIKEFSQGLVLVEEFLRGASSYAKSFIDLAAAVAIKKSLESYLDQEEDDEQRKNGWSRYNEISIRSLCNDIIILPKWRNIVLLELNMPREQTSLIISVMDKLRMVPDFEELIPLLMRDLFDLDVLKHVLVEHPESYVIDVFKYLNTVLPEEVLCENPQVMEDENIASGNKPDIWVMYLLKALRREKINEEEFFIRCLTARFPDVRIEAAKALSVFKQEWSHKVLPALENAYIKEPVIKIRERLLNLIEKDNENKTKEQRRVDISSMKVSPSIFDICLLNTKIAGTIYHDIMEVEGRIEAGDILYLVREPDNRFDEKAIAITDAEGYVLGYVPRTDNQVPAFMIDSGERLYAVLQSVNVENGKADIQIMINKKPEKEGKVIKFPY